MTIQFDQIPETNEVPNSVTEVRSSGPTGTEPKKVLIIAAQLTGTANEIFPALSKTSGDAAAGRGSMLGDMVRAYREVDSVSEVDGIGIDASTGTKASGSVLFAGTATANGALVILIGGKKYTLSVPSGALASGVAALFKAAVDAYEYSLVTTGTILADSVPLDARWAGPSGNDILIQVVTNVPGITVTPTALSGGATDPDLALALAEIAPADYDTVVLGFSDDTSIAALEAEMARRALPIVEMQGSFFYGLRVDKTLHSTVVSAQSSRNSEHGIPASTGGSPTPPWIFAAQAAAVDTLTYASDPGVPRAEQELPGCIAPTKADHLDIEERTQLLGVGVSTFDVVAGKCRIERLVTTYKLDKQGQPDRKFREITTMRIIQDYRRKWRRHSLPLRTRKLVDDGTPVKPGIRVTTPSSGKAMMDAFYADYARTGNVQHVDAFIASSRCERHDGDRNRLDFFHPVRVGDIVITVASAIEIQ